MNNAKRRMQNGRGWRPDNFDFHRRCSGLLLHISSLPGPHGSGDLSDEAHAFVDFCADAGQSWWQMLPVGPPGDHPGNSPYSSYSSAGGSPYLVSLEGLARHGLLGRAAPLPSPPASDQRVNFRAVRAFREHALRVAYARFRADRTTGDFERFVSREKDWLEDFALYCALKQCHRGAPWYEWPPGVRDRRPVALHEAAATLSEEVNFHRFVQFAFHRQWHALRDHAHDKGVGLIGDVPIFVTHDSVDVWCNPHLFQLERSGRPKRVTGVPPDAFSDQGQRWGHPQYEWKAHERENFRWWVNRFERTFRLFDALRIDHFLGFSRVWSIPADEPTAIHGRWVRSPGRELFAVLKKELGERPIIAEDLGVVTSQAAALRDELRFPGMRVLQFGFGGNGDGDDYHRPHRYAANSVAYAGTHDSNTVVGWYRKLPAADRRNALQYLGGDEQTVHRAAIRALMASPADTVIFQVQDVLGLDDRARMNTPGTASGNWRWRLPPGALKPVYATDLRNLAELTGRKQPM